MAIPDSVNPTREEIERRLERVLMGPSNTVEMSLPDYQEIHRFALRALDMRDGIERCLKQHRCGERLLSVIGSYIKEFDDGADNSEEDPMLTEGQRRRRR